VIEKSDPQSTRYCTCVVHYAFEANLCGANCRVTQPSVFSSTCLYATVSSMCWKEEKSDLFGRTLFSPTTRWPAGGVPISRSVCGCDRSSSSPALTFFEARHHRLPTTGRVDIIIIHSPRFSDSTCRQVLRIFESLHIILPSYCLL